MTLGRGVGWIPSFRNRVILISALKTLVKEPKADMLLKGENYVAYNIFLCCPIIYIINIVPF